MAKITAKELYQRQITLQELGASGHQKLQEAKITIVGCGGLGSVAAVYLAASGIGNIHLIDFDTVDVSNLHRQVYYKTTDIGKSKCEVLANYIQSISPFVNVTFSDVSVSKKNVFHLIASADVVLDCTDSLPIKYLLNDACVLEDKVLVYGSLYKFDGYVATFNYLKENGNRTANLRDAFPEIPTENIPNCSELGTLNPIVGIIGLMQANEVLKIVANIGKPLVNELLIYNSLDNTQFKMKLQSKISHSEQRRRISKLFETENYESVLCNFTDGNTISQEKFKQLLAQKSNAKIISIIDDDSLKLPFKVAENVPLYEFEGWLDSLENPTGNFVVVCKQGVSSLMAVHLFKVKHPTANVLSLEGGVVKFMVS